MKNLPFRLGTTSFIYPDDILPNIERLKNRVDDIEILFFEVTGPSSLPTESTLKRIAAIKEESQLSFTLHTPLDASLASEDFARRSSSIEKVCLAIESVHRIEPYAYILHIYLGDKEKDTPPHDLASWRERASDSLKKILARTGVTSRDICIESIDYDFSLIEPVVKKLDLSVALDVGHFERDDRPLEMYLERYLARSRVIQWHGVDPTGRDHRSLVHYPKAQTKLLLDSLFNASYQGILTIEVFRESDFEESLTLVTQLLKERGYDA